MTLTPATAPSAPGGALLAEVERLMAAEPLDAAYLEGLCLELDGRIVRGDAMIGILPVEAYDVLVRGYTAAAFAGRSTAWVPLGRRLLDPRVGWTPTWPSPHPFPVGGTEQLDSALRCFAEAARHGDRQGAYLFAALGREAVDRVGPHALTLLEPLRADDPTGEANYWSGIVHYLRGDGGAAVAHHRRAAAAGNADAMFELHVLYGTGDVVPPDEEAAREWLLRAADRDHPRALYNVAAAHASGRGFPRDEAAAAGWYERAAAAGNARAAATLGVMYLLGSGVPTDAGRAAGWFDRAEEQGYDVDGWLEQLGMSRPS
ncbi:tetratricopeptide repeat protein [Micromonospora sp. CPCC 205561]|uniref:tetratricopeptide repeat protein n=1 Tax=Micromonospora sp. CPCC 205561 TaxID=3122407 RepID=UPI002FF31AE7